MKTQLSTVLNIMLIVLMAISAILSIVFYLGTSAYGPDTEFSEQITILGWRLNVFLNWSYLLVLIGAAAALVFPMIQMFTNPAASKKTFMALGVMVVVVILAYLVASPDIYKFPGYEKFYYEDNSLDPNTFSKYVDTALWSMYILMFLAVASVLYSEISKMFK